MIWIITILISYVFALWASVWGIKQCLLRYNIPTTVGNISSEMFENPVIIVVFIPYINILYGIGYLVIGLVNKYKDYEL